MEEEKNITNIKIIYWVVTLIPIVFLNLSPYLGISFPETIDNDETFHKLVLGFSLVFVLFLLGTFGSYKCIVFSEFIVAKIIASLFLLLYLASIIAMIYFFLRGHVN